MGATTQYGSWANLMLEDYSSIEDAIGQLLDGAQTDFDLRSIASDYRKEINNVLPEGLHLNGDLVYGPYPIPAWWGDAESTERRELLDAIAAIDLIPIMNKHEKSFYELCGCLRNEAGAHRVGCPDHPQGDPGAPKS